MFKRRDAFIVAAAGVGLALFAFFMQQSSGSGFPLDDSWIHQTYGRNLAQTGQWAFIPGYPSAGSTSPLYTLLLALGYLLNVSYFTWAWCLGFLALAGGGLIAARLAERLFPRVRGVGLGAGLAIVTAWHLLWAAASGMETMIFCALSLLVIDLALRQLEAHPDAHRNRRDGALFGIGGALLIATRPEGVLLVGMAGALTLFYLLMSASHRHALIHWAGGALIIGLIALTPYLLLNFSLNGSILPNTFSAKQAEYAPLNNLSFFENLREMVTPLTAGGQLMLVPGVLIAIAAFWRRERGAAFLLRALPLLWSMALLLIFTLRLPAPYQHGRYVIPTLPTFIVLGIGGTLILAGARWQSFIARVLARSLALAVVAVFLAFMLVGARTFAHDVELINSDMVVAAHWLDANIPPTPENFLAVHDIGAVGFFASRVDRPRPILDIAGLVSPEVIPLFYKPQALLDLMRARKVRYLMVLPPQWEALWVGDPVRWGREFCLRFNAMGGMGGMTIYEFRPGQRFAANQPCPEQ